MTTPKSAPETWCAAEREPKRWGTSDSSSGQGPLDYKKRKGWWNVIEADNEDQDASLLDPHMTELVAELERLEPATRALPLRAKVNIISLSTRASSMSAPKVTTHVFPISHGRAGAPIGTNTTGQEAEGPHCLSGTGGHS